MSGYSGVGILYISGLEAIASAVHLHPDSRDRY